MGKVMTMKEAISAYVKSGDTLFLSGMQHGEPSAAVHEIVRQKIDHLTVISCLVACTSLLIGEGLVDKVITGFIMQDIERTYSLIRAKSMGRLPVFQEYSHFGLSLAMFAGQMGLPFIPGKSQIGSDIMKHNPGIKTIECPFTGVKLAAVQAINPDIGIFHCQRADAEGNAQKWGTLGIDQEGINACKKIIVTTEKIVDPDIIRRDPNRTIIPAFRVQAVVEQPWGAHPMHLAGFYGNDQSGFARELSTQEGFENYVNKLVYGVKDWNEYLKVRASIKGPGYFENMKVKPLFSEPIITGTEVHPL
jgi:glutaconate CoA-transferase subunit A